MTTAELKDEVEKYRTGLNDKSGKICHFSETGPVGMALIDAVVSTLETQQAKIDQLESKLKSQAG